MRKRDADRARPAVAVRDRALIGAGVLAFAVLLSLATAGVITQAGMGCNSCHAMLPYVEAHASGPHASLRCSACHVSGSPVASVAEGMRAVGWHVSALVRRAPTSVVVSDSPCRACHEQLLKETVVSGGIAVRHADFLAQPCRDCHAGAAHRLPEHRRYASASMADCAVCHTDADSDPRGCDRCHVGDVVRDPSTVEIAPTHGPDWLARHGSGDTETCGRCHAERACFECHGVVIPHPDDWLLAHGERAKRSTSPGCRRCHEATWCVACHGLEMPHLPGFLPRHGAIARENRAQVCYGCHAAERCDACHFASSHPETAGVDIGHRW